MRILLAILVAALTCGNIFPADKPTPAQLAESNFFGSWLELERISGGVSTKDPNNLCGQSFAKDKWFSWGRRGELSAGNGEGGARIYTNTDPMRVDFLSGATKDKTGQLIVSVMPCIFSYDRGHLTIAYGSKWTPENEKPEGKDFPGRPTDFKSTKENKLVVVHMVRCAFYDQD